MRQRNKTVRARGRITRHAWPLTVANCHHLMNGLLRAAKRLRNIMDCDSRFEYFHYFFFVIQRDMALLFAGKIET